MKEIKDKVILGEALGSLANFPDDCLDFSVCDPPYGIKFMSKSWDYDVPKAEVWKALLRVLKPGAHILIFGGTRTFHRLVVEIEDAEFEIRDTIAWHYGEGFPKNMNISKAIDKAAGADREVIGKRKESGPDFSNDQFTKQGSMMKTWTKASRLQIDITTPTTDNAKKWNGYGTALKPATELICLARKPISEKTIASNVLKHGTGALNIQGSKIPLNKYDLEEYIPKRCGWKDGINYNQGESEKGFLAGAKEQHQVLKPDGRWPANVIFDESAAKELDKQSGNLTSGDIKPHHVIKESENNSMSGKNYFRTGQDYPGDLGGASRFFYVAKASKTEKNTLCENIEVRQSKGGGGLNSDAAGAYGSVKAKQQNFHPTVKPLSLIKYLVNLISFPGAWGIDLYAGSGTFALACKELFLHWTLIERDPEYHKIIEARLRQGYLIDSMK